ncbi:MAG: methyltransferase domain-containing protein [Nitrospiraceae bacterium]|nr:methyltransferase domain-containing protein [Nitrospiraceae bacterium]
MNSETLSILRSPYTHKPLRLEKEKTPDDKNIEYLVSDSGEKFSIVDEIPIFQKEEELKGLDKKYQLIYDKMSWYYDISSRTVMLILDGGVKKVRRDFLKELEIKDNSRVLEVSVGTGENLNHLPRSAKYYGLDIAMKPLRLCQKKMKKIGLDLELFYANAEALPFKDECFDVVFHVGGINYFTNKKAAIDEMIRVAKPGTKIAIIDETEKLAWGASWIVPGARNYYKRDEPIEPPVKLLPKDMREVEVKYTTHGLLYCLSFRKP